MREKVGGGETEMWLQVGGVGTGDQGRRGLWRRGTGGGGGPVEAGTSGGGTSGGRPGGGRTGGGGTKIKGMSLHGHVASSGGIVWRLLAARRLLW